DVRVLCDVDLAQTAKAAARFPGAEIVQDFRRVIERKDLDGVVISTPDHWHAIPAVWAMKSGKHVYCEKPLAHSVYECRVMIETAKEEKKVTQMGTQIHAGANYRRVVELVQSGAIGTVERVEVWCDRKADRGKLAGPGNPIPSTLDYDLWIGPAPMRPFDPKVVPFHWRWWWEFGGGVLADMGCHYMDLVHWSLDLKHATRISATGTRLTDADNTVPAELKADFHYPAQKDRPAVHLTWYHGNPGPLDENGKVRGYGMGSGVLFHGSKGQLVADYGRHRLLPEPQFAGFVRPAPTIPDSVGHHQEWINGIRNGTATTCNFAYSGALAETVLLGNVAFRLGKEIEWDPKRLKVKNVPQSEWEELVRREYRASWKLKG
ncbi:MAG: Gfo/Idh/MocA family oxidoreductase, partial [Armatimonadetes bacterium]|nr:Gfo/Idh/MocA family oxidoreductase [Armatimonadota bacterium]